MRFRTWLETNDIFGFDRPQEPITKVPEDKPIHQFNLELMMEYLSRRHIGVYEATSRFINEIQWGNLELPGSLKLEIDTGWTFHLKKLGIDLEGTPRWLTKKLFQLNRAGYGGFEDQVATEVFDEMQKLAYGSLERPSRDFDGLESLVLYLAGKARRAAKPYFIYEGIKKRDADNYQIVFGMAGHGVEAPDHRRVEQINTDVSYDRKAGLIRISNYTIESPVGGPHSWELMPSDMDAYFFPSQQRDELAEVLMVQFKYY